MTRPMLLKELLRKALEYSPSIKPERLSIRARCKVDVGAVPEADHNDDSPRQLECRPPRYRYKSLRYLLKFDAK